MANTFQTPPDAMQGTESSGLTPTNGLQEANSNTGSARDCAQEQAALCPQWEELATSDNRTFFANHATGSTTWQKPEVVTDEDRANIQAGLPAAWQALVDSDGRTYYANHDSRTTTFDRPEGPTGELPLGWEMLRNPQGVAYFADHDTHTATWDDPRSA